jgi:hypothetical protein
MSGKIAGISFLLVCVVLAILLVTKTISNINSAGIFAVALVVLGGLSNGFRRNAKGN